MTKNEQYASALVAAGAKEASAHLLTLRPRRRAGPTFVSVERCGRAGVRRPGGPARGPAVRRLSPHPEHLGAGAWPAGAGGCDRTPSRGFHGPGGHSMTGRHHAD